MAHESEPQLGSSSAVGCLADSLSVIYRGHEFVESDHEIISVFSLPLIKKKRAIISYWQKYMYVLSVLVTAKE